MNLTFIPSDFDDLKSSLKGQLGPNHQFFSDDCMVRRAIRRSGKKAISKFDPIVYNCGLLDKVRNKFLDGFKSVTVNVDGAKIVSYE